jgi:hypothetical protein
VLSHRLRAPPPAVRTLYCTGKFFVFAAGNLNTKKEKKKGKREEERGEERRKREGKGKGFVVSEL